MARSRRDDFQGLWNVAGRPGDDPLQRGDDVLLEVRGYLAHEALLRAGGRGFDQQRDRRTSTRRSAATRLQPVLERRHEPFHLSKLRKNEPDPNRVAARLSLLLIGVTAAGVKRGE